VLSYRFLVCHAVDVPTLMRQRNGQIGEIVALVCFAMIFSDGSNAA
jgi:hypothetical protein